MFYKWLKLAAFQEALEVSVGSALQLSDSAYNPELGGIHRECLVHRQAPENVTLEAK